MSVGDVVLDPCKFGHDAAQMELIHCFGELPIAGYLEDTAALARSAARFISTIAICKECGLVQQGTRSARENLVKHVYSDYQVTYSMSETVRKYSIALFKKAAALADLKSGDAVVEVGSNDGKFLEMIQEFEMRPIGFEPSKKLAKKSNNDGILVIPDFFGLTSANRFLEENGPIKLLITCHTLEHAFDIGDFLDGIAAILTPDGVAVIEVPYLRLQLINGHFEAMSFQHESLFTVGSLVGALEQAGLSAFDAEFTKRDGGAMVVYVRKSDLTQTRRVPLILDLVQFEDILKLNCTSGYQDFFGRVSVMQDNVRNFFTEIVRQGETVCSYGAGGKGQNLMNMLHLDEELIKFCIDDAPGSAGKFIPGTGIQVVPSTSKKLSNVSTVFVSAPTHIEQILSKNIPSLQGARYLVTVPDLHYVAHDNVQ
jgi:hypothetical protein